MKLYVSGVQWIYSNLAGQSVSADREGLVGSAKMLNSIKINSSAKSSDNMNENQGAYKGSWESGTNTYEWLPL